MKFKIDQNLPDEARDVLVAAGHDVLTVYDRTLNKAALRKVKFRPE